MIPTPEERSENLARLYEDIRRALNNHETERAVRLSVRLTAEIADDDFLRSQSYPACLECNGYAEVVDPEHPERKTMCTSAPKACPGNKYGRMSHTQYAAYLDAKLTPRQPTVTETIPAADEAGEVPRLPADELKPTKLSDAEREYERLRSMPGSGQVDRPEPEERAAKIIQS